MRAERIGIPMDLVGIPVDICAEYPFGAVVVARACRLRRHAWSRGWPSQELEES